MCILQCYNFMSEIFLWNVCVLEYAYYISCSSCARYLTYFCVYLYFYLACIASNYLKACILLLSSHTNKQQTPVSLKYVPHVQCVWWRYLYFYTYKLYICFTCTKSLWSSLLVAVCWCWYITCCLQV